MENYLNHYQSCHFGITVKLFQMYYQKMHPLTMKQNQDHIIVYEIEMILK